MIYKNDVRDFFNHLALSWDDHMIRNNDIINFILDNAEIHKGNRILDVACGTGVLIPDYLDRKVNSIVGVDLSPQMIHIAHQKFMQPNVHFLCADAESADIGHNYDTIMIYNAFPHFSHPEQLIAHLSTLLAPNGVLSVAHSMSREQINEHHSTFASKVSLGLPPIEDLSHIFERYLSVTMALSNESMYQIVGHRLQS